MMDILRVALRELVQRLEPHGIDLFVIGGYGLVLRTNAIAASGERTLGGKTPLTRSTEDIDLILGEAIISSTNHAMQIRATLDDLGYTVIKGAENYQFKKSVERFGRSQTIKVDWHAAPVSESNLAKVKIDERRVRPELFREFHAHRTDEAVFVEDSAMSIDVSDDESPAIIRVPHPFAYLTLKLFALRDGKIKSVPSDYFHHALDMFTIWATTTQREYDEALEMRRKYADNSIAKEAREIVSALFEGSPSYAILALRVAAQEARVEVSDSSVRQFRIDVRALLGSSDRETETE